jgi:hypothetical protein
MLIVRLALAVGTLQAEDHLTTTATQRYFNVEQRNLKSSADLVPADKCSYRLTPGRLMMFSINATQRNYSECTILKGEAVPELEKKVGAEGQGRGQQGVEGLVYLLRGGAQGHG